MKITFLGAGSSVFVKNVLGDCLCTPVLERATISLYDIDESRLEDSYLMLSTINKNSNDSKATIEKYCGAKNRKDALRDSDFIINAVQIGGYIPCTFIDFEIPKKYGLRQTIADTLGIGGIMRGLRTIPVMQDFANDIEEVCPNAWLLNYTNPMSILTGYMQRYTKVKTIGLCHSVQVCTKDLLKTLDMEDKIDGRQELIGGINHMGWLLEIKDKDGNDLYPEIKKRAAYKNLTEKHGDMVRYDYMKHLGYYCTESSEHNAEYNPFYIKSKYPELIEWFNIPLDEYPRRCINNIERWETTREEIMQNGNITHERSAEYASKIIEALWTGDAYEFGGNVINEGYIDNLVAEACVEVKCVAEKDKITPQPLGRLPVHLAGMNMSNINCQLMTIEAAVSRKKEDIYKAAMLDPHTAAELSLDDIVKMCDELIEAHGEYMAMYK